MMGVKSMLNFWVPKHLPHKISYLEELWMMRSMAHYETEHLLLSWTTFFDTPSAVSVVIWIDPKFRVGNPRDLSSEVLSRGGSSPREPW